MGDSAGPRVDTPAQFSTEIGGHSAQLGSVRALLGGWLADHGFARGQATDLLLAVDEAAANSIEHGYRGAGPGPVRITAVVEAGLLVVTVSDDGCWRTPDPTPVGLRGRGLAIMRAVSDSVDVETGQGTTVTLRVAVAPA
ncbi:ATP-binding protein [Actinokineospora bangkokensis]|uniref:Histidine kinase/HSP90-like ATPase domain-containing protein n=1 Tax=Actinokineospora bangkokensis TaxID=1193682 RepID=A0A1Q9LNW1_9PSEU|nr:ATP-binding protein [Actinokineospora bangkokensis]OLR93710.1 hypothetical protein BJP25_15755 [Actinokineospora bangkokensis]